MFFYFNFKFTLISFHADLICTNIIEHHFPIIRCIFIFSLGYYYFYGNSMENGCLHNTALLGDELKDMLDKNLFGQHIVKEVVPKAIKSHLLKRIQRKLLSCHSTVHKEQVKHLLAK